MLKKGDIVLLVGLAITILVSFAGIKFLNRSSSTDHRIAVIKQNGQVLKKIDLDTVKEPQRIEVGGDYKEIIEVEKGKIRFGEANCPDKLCVKTGWLSNKGDRAVCLPNKTIVSIEGENTKVDGVTY